MKYYLIGEKLSHSYSKPIHNLLGGYEYELKCLSLQELDDFFIKKEFKGLNVTIPYKKAVLKYCNTLSQSARKIGSVNTITVEKDGSLKGHNTDYVGFLYMAKRAGIEFHGKKVLILGTGGAGITAAAAAEDNRASQVVFVSRNGSVNYENIYEHINSDIIVNTTPVGMYPKNGERLIDLARFINCSGVIDVIYNPLKTLFLIDAQKLGVPFTNGLSMLVAQAKYANDLFLDKTTPDEIIEQIYAKTVSGMKNIVFVGMPGSGKTTIGKITAKMLDRKFIDTDELIEQETGMDIKEIFSRFGEKHFRELEVRAVANACKQLGVVIATGGGAILRQDNTTAIRQNSFTVFLERDINSLATEGRPLSKNLKSIDEMYNQRKGFYESVCDFKISQSKPEIIAQEVVEKYNENTCD
ncbi:MAG TPA: shikimate kinase [Clostridia bacterium]|nr:shikimate kinase [Clostridia bacterium]